MPPPSLRIRPITVDDVPQFREVGNVVFRERRFMAFVEGFPLDECRAFVESNLKLGNPQLIAEIDGRLVGWCDVRRSPLPVHAHVGNLGMGVLPEFRGQGVGERLIRTAIEASRAAGFERLELHVYAKNTVAEALYRKVGFVREGTLARGKKIDGEYDDVHVMGLLL
jgi:ribosomal protein S18 acetylase RimI-like enzyme